MRSRRLMCAVTAAVLLVPVTARASQLTSLSDTESTPPLSALTSEVQTEAGYLKALYCTPPAAKPRVLTLAAAVKNVNTYVVKHSTAAARRKFAHTSAAKTERGSLAAAATAAAANSPVGALDALLRAHHLQPRDPMPLIDAAPLLTDGKKPNEALAFLAAATTLPAPDHQPWGVATKALIANNRGYALLAVNNWKAAQAALTTARKVAPSWPKPISTSPSPTCAETSRSRRPG